MFDDDEYKKIYIFENWIKIPDERSIRTGRAKSEILCDSTKLVIEVPRPEILFHSVFSERKQIGLRFRMKFQKIYFYIENVGISSKYEIIGWIKIALEKH